ncbi:hypothetical protein BH23GEM5_BH23GEM5_25800 [soil metagenome]
MLLFELPSVPRSGHSLRTLLFQVNDMSKLLAILAAFLLLLAACRDSTGPTGIDGEYTLVAINTQALPVTVRSNNAGRIDFTSSTLALRPDFTYTETINRHIVLAGAAGATEYSDVVIVNGSYKVAGNRVTFTELTDDGTEVGIPYTGTVDGNSLTYRFDGDSYSFRK